MFLLVLFLLSEGFHVVAHLMVLLHLYSTREMSRERKIGYFTWDLISNLAAGFLTGWFQVMVIIHLMIHLYAISHLIQPFSLFYDAVFQLSESSVLVSKLPNNIRIQYVVGTLFDISTHLLNCYALLHFWMDEIRS